MVIRNDTEGLLSCLQGEMEEEGGSREHSQRGRGVCDKGGQQWALHTTQSHEFLTEHKFVGKSLLRKWVGLSLTRCRAWSSHCPGERASHTLTRKGVTQGVSPDGASLASPLRSLRWPRSKVSDIAQLHH